MSCTLTHVLADTHTLSQTSSKLIHTRGVSLQHSGIGSPRHSVRYFLHTHTCHTLTHTNYISFDLHTCHTFIHITHSHTLTHSRATLLTLTQLTHTTHMSHPHKNTLTRCTHPSNSHKHSYVLKCHASHSYTLTHINTLVIRTSRRSLYVTHTHHTHYTKCPKYVIHTHTHSHTLELASHIHTFTNALHIPLCVSTRTKWSFGKRSKNE